jgi:CubicO group peptidase (beta-lactamase class C family)
MKVFYSLVLTLSLFIFSCDANTSIFPDAQEVREKMDKEFSAADLHAIVAIGINDEGEQIVYNKGKAVWEEGLDVHPDHIFRIYSMTKMVTSIAALQLVEQGKFGLDEDLSSIMPEMSEIPIYKEGELVPAKNPITLRHLLSHTSGFGYLGITTENIEYDIENWDYEDAPRLFESGTKFLYGTSTDWAGKLVEKISGQNLEDYFREYITGPLKMNRTFFNVPDSLKQYIVSYGHRGEDGKQPLVENPNRVPKDKSTYLSGGGGLFSSPSDYTKLLKCLLNYGTYENGQLLSKTMVKEMIKNQVGDINLDPVGNYYNSRFCCNFEGLMDEDSKWGLAFMIDNTGKSFGRQKGTVLWGGLYNTYFFIDYKSGIAGSIYTQHIPFNHPQTSELFDRFSEILYLGIERD